MSLTSELLMLIVTLAICATVFIALYRYATQGGEIPKTSADKAELTARVVLIAVVSLTTLMLLMSFERRGGFPEIPEGILIVNGAAVALYIGVQVIGTTQATREMRMRVVELQRKSLDNPDNVRYAWDLAAAKLEDYLTRNLQQVKWIFIIAVLAMFSGFCVVVYGITRTLQASNISVALVSTGAGVITQFIGVTFMVIYRSTMDQASSYMVILERINNIGMAVQILEQISDAAPELKNATRAEIVKSLAIGPPQVRNLAIPRRDAPNKRQNPKAE